MKRFKNIFSYLMILLILLSSMQFPYLKGETNIQAYAADNASSTLLSDDLATGEALYAVTDALPSDAVHSDAETVALDEAWLTADLILNGNSYSVQQLYDDTQYYYNITGDLNLPVSGANGSTVSWDSSDETVVAVNGTVYRPGFLEGGKDAILTATISKGEAVVQKTFNVDIRSLDKTEDDEAVLADDSWLVYEALVLPKPGTFGSVTDNVYLPSAGKNGCTISWSSSDETVVALNGTVTRPVYPQEDAYVTLTATITSGNSKLNECFYLTVKTEDERVTSDEAWLTADLILNGNSYTEIQLSDGTPYYYNITSNLNLPVTGKNGSTISWNSSNTSVVESNGTVYRQVYEDKAATLTATISIADGAVQSQKTFKVCVSSIEPAPEVSLQSDYTWLDYNVACGSWYTDQVSWDLPLPILGESGSIITWTSSDSAVVASNGKITRPAFIEGDKQVTLTATISHGDLSVQSEFFVNIIALAPTDEEKVAIDKAWLAPELVLNGNTAANVKTKLYLPKATEECWSPSGYYGGSTISWESSSPDVVFTDGTVIRPDEAQGDQPVILTATISNGGAVDVTTFDMVVTAVEEFPVALKYDDFSSRQDSLQFNGESGMNSALDGDGNSIQVLQFNDDGQALGGSIFTKNKIHLKDDMSFSTYFSISNNHSNYATGDGGFTFTLQAANNTSYGQSLGALGADGIKPSISIAFKALYYQGPDYGQASTYGVDESVAVFYNGNNNASANWVPHGYTNVWIEYDGPSKILELRLSSSEDRPRDPYIRLENVDLVQSLTSAGTSLGIGDVQDVYAGFTGSVGDAKDTIQIQRWYFKNDSTPIDLAPYRFIDASDVTLSANPPGGQASSTVTAYVYGNDGPAAGVPVEFFTSFGTLDSSAVITDSSGMASIMLSANVSGNAVVKAIAAGGTMASTEVSLAVTDEDRVVFDREWLTDERILNGNSDLSNITKDLVLPTLGLNGSNISWTSSKADVVASDGTVTTPAFAQGDQMVTLTAAISKGSLTVEKIFNITVKVSDADLAAADSDWLTVQVLNGNSSYDSVIQDVNLPETGVNGSTISWMSSDAGVIALDGKVTRPTYTQGDQTATLTATISKGLAVVKKEFIIKVPALGPSDIEAVNADYGWLTDGVILNSNSSLDNVTSNLNLPVLGPRGTAINWVSDAETVAAQDGKVTRPTYTQGDKAVTLTATITKGTESNHKTFALIVMKLDQSDAEAVASDMEWLSISRTFGENLSPYSIIQNLMLPDSAPAGSSITWSSNMPGVISDGGVVTRPEYLDGHKSVTMTATLVKGGVQDTAAYQYTVLAKPDTFPPKVTNTAPANNSAGVVWDTKEITITFDEDIKRGTQAEAAGSNTFGIELHSLNSPQITAAINGNKLIVTPFSDMASGVNELVIPAGAVTDMSGNPVEEFKLSFSVEQKQVNKIEVISSNPADSAKQVSLSPELSFSYNYSDIVEGRTFSGISMRTKAGKVIPVTAALNGNTVTLGLSTALEAGTVYEIIIPAGAVQDRFINDSSPRTIQFRTQTDAKVPEVASTYPIDSQSGVDIRQNIEINFSETMNAKDCKLKLLDNQGSLVRTYIKNLNGSQTGVVLEPYVPLKPNTKYMVVGPYDSAINPSQLEFMMNFTTGGNAIGIDKISPVYDLLEAPINTPVEIEFSSPVTRGAEFANIKISDSKGNPVIFNALEVSDKVVLTSSSQLSPAETYTVNIPGGAYKNADNGLNDAFKFKFTTARRLDPGTFSIYPSSTWLVNKPVTFNTSRVENIFKSAGYEITSFAWNFGDGDTGSGKNPSHTYKETGDFPVTLTLQDNKGFSYEVVQTVTIQVLSNPTMSVSHTWRGNLYVTKLGSDITKLFNIRIEYNGQFVPGETIKVQLYKNDVLQYDLGTVTAGSGDNKYVYPFPYQKHVLNGTYELVFTCDSLQEKPVVREPVNIIGISHKAPLRIRLYNKDSHIAYNFYEEADYLNVTLNGEKKIAVKEWFNDVNAYGYAIKESLQVSQAYTFSIDGWVSDTERIWNGGDYSHPVIFRAKPVKFGINRISCPELTNTTSPLFIEGVNIDPVTIKLDGDWHGLEPGYYEIKTDSDRLNLTSAVPEIKLNPGLDLRVGEYLLARMVSKNGIKSPWRYAGIRVVPKPTLGLGTKLNVSFVDGEYRISAPVGLKELIGDRIPLLDGVPLLDMSQSFGLSADTPILSGTLNEYGELDMYFNGGGSYEKTNTKETNKKKLKKVVSAGYEIDAEIDGQLCFVYDRISKDWKLYLACISLDGYGGYSWTKGYKVPKINIGVDGKLKMGADVRGTLIINKSDSSAREYSGIIRFAPIVKVSIQGGPDWVNVTGWVDGRIPAEVHIPTGYVQAEVSVTAGVDATFLTYSETLWEKELFSAHWDNGKKKVTYNSLSVGSQPLAAKLDTNDAKLTLLSRDYLNRESGWVAESQAKQEKPLPAAGEITPFMKSAVLSTVSEETNPQLEKMEDNIYPDAEVQLAHNGDELWMVWTDDNPERSAVNRTQMRYSVLKDGSWSEPAWIGQDGTADFSPVTASTGNGILMAWQNIKQAVPEDAGLGALIENSEISVTGSVYRTGGSDVQMVTLTDDDKFDHSPKLAADGEDALLIWTKSEGVGFSLGSDLEQYQSPANSDRLFYSSWDGSTWSTPAEIEGSLPTVMDSSLTMNGNEGLLLYTLDMDNDQSTQEDREIFARIYNGSFWGEAEQITDNQVPDSNPKAVYSNGGWFITWYQDDSIMYKDGLDGEARTQEFLKNVQSGYEIAAKDGLKPQVALVYKHIAEDQVQSLSTSFYDIDSGVWSDEIPLTEEEGYVRSFSPVFTRDGKLNIAYTQAEIITEAIDDVEYKKISDKVDLHKLTYTPVHDLALSTEDGLEVSPEIPLPGTMTTVSATIMNQGDFAENATLYLYDGNPDDGGIKIGEARMAQPIPARSSAQIEAEWLVGTEEKDAYEIYAVVQPDEGVTEIDNSNNTINHMIATADIAVTSLECENLAEDDFLVTATVDNIGSKTLKGAKAQLDQGLNGNILETRELGELQPGQEVVLTLLVSSRDLTVDENGNINMTMRALLPDGVEENSTDNNTSEFVLEAAPIIVESESPGQGETKVDIQKPLTLSFNMNVEKGAGFDQIVLQDDDLNTIDITKTLEGNTLTVTPQSAMAYNTGYTLTIPEEAVGDSYGHAMEGNYSLSFTTTASSPEVVFAYPGNEMDSVALDTDIKMQYNQAVSEGPAYEEIAMYGPDSEEIPVSVSLKGEWMYIHPTGQLNENTSYSLMIPKGVVKNGNGEAQQEDYTLGFTVGTAVENGDNDNDSGHSSTDKDSKRRDSEQPAYRISRQVSNDGSSTAIVEIDEQVILKQKTDNTMVTVDVSGEVKEDGKIQVDLTGNVLKQLVTNKLGLNAVTGKCDVRLPAELIKSLTGEGENSITLTIAENNRKLPDNGMVSTGIFDLAITAGGKPVTKFEPSVVVTIPLDKSKVGNGKRIIVCVYDETAGTWQPVGGLADTAEGSVSFNARHFSTYAAFETIKSFDDVTSSWAKEKVEILASRHLINGTTEKTYDPEDSVTRAEFAALIVRPLYMEITKSKGTFKDVAEGSWYADAVETAYDLGLVSGTGMERFEPDAKISREQLAVIAYRLCQYKNKKWTEDSIDKTFADFQNISAYAEEAVNFVSKAGIMTGSGGMFEPQRSTTRQEAAVVLYRLLEYMGEL